jgi:hypothetical protein
MIKILKTMCALLMMSMLLISVKPFGGNLPPVEQTSSISGIAYF